MRDISTITPRELRQLWREIMPREVRLLGVGAQCYKCPKSEESPEYVTAVFGEARLSIYFGSQPEVWVEIDQNKRKHPLPLLGTNSNEI